MGNVTGLSYNTFNGVFRNSLKSVVFGSNDVNNGLTTIPTGFCSKAPYLEEVTINRSVSTIGESAFYECTGLTSITIPENVTNIGQAAFHSCTNLTNITIRNRLSNLTFGYAVVYDSGLTDVYYDGTSDSWNVYVYPNIDNSDSGNQKLHDATKHWNN